MLIAGRSRSENHCPVHESGQAHGPSAASGAEKVFAAPGQRQDHAAPRAAEPKAAQKHGAALSNIEITDANIGLFRPCAKKYGVDFTLRKDATTQPPHYIVIFKAKDADNMEQAFKEFTAKKLQREERPSIRKDIAASKEKAAARNADRAKEKFKERGMSR